MKRNGSEAAFDREKIAAAVTKANLATDQPPELSVLAVNKMDLVGFSEERFNEIVTEYSD